MKKLMLFFTVMLCFYTRAQNAQDINEKIFKELLSLDKFSKAKDPDITLKIKQLSAKYNLNFNDSLNGFYYMIIANTLSDQLKKDEAEVAIKKSNAFYTKANNPSGISKSFMNLGNLYLFKGDQQNALKYYNKGLFIAEKNSLNKMMGLINKNIGVVFMNQEKFKDALLYSNKALDLFLKINNKKEIAGIYINIGNVYYNQYDADKALLYYKKSEKICIEINDNFNLGTIYNNIGDVYYVDKKDKINGLKYLKKSLEYKTKYNSSDDVIFQHTNLGGFYSLYNDFINANYHLKIAEKMALQSNNKIELSHIYLTYSTMYVSKKDFRSALENYKLHTQFKDSIINIESLKSVKELETKYQTAKKQKQIIAQQAEAKQKNIYLIVLLILAFLIGLIGYLIYKQQRQKNQQQAQENELKSAIVQIENQNKLQEQRLSISRDLHDNIGSQLTFIISSVDNVKYGFDITNEKLDNKLTNISSFAKDTIVELRDTIWAMNSNEISFEDLDIRISNFIEKAKLSTENISFSFAIDENLKTNKLSSVEGMNVYRTIQEAINNSLKYAEANMISVNIKPIDNKTAILIKDNGKGFDVQEQIASATADKSEVATRGNGLNNMKKRIEEIGGKFNLTSDNEGTKIEILL